MDARTSTLALCLALALPALARAEDEPMETELGDRPTSGTPSVISGRTLGEGETVIAVRAGFPGLSGEAIFAPSSRLSIGPRLDLVYASPLVAFPTGFGASFSMPVRFHVYGHEHLDLALVARPVLSLAQGKLVGETTAFANVFGLAAGLALGARLGYEVHEGLTLVAGLGGEAHVVSVPDANETYGVGAITATLGIEGAISMSTSLFAELEGGYGFARDVAFGGDRGVVRLWLGVAFLL